MNEDTLTQPENETKEYKPLTFQEIHAMTLSLPNLDSISWVDLVRAVESAHGIK